MENDEILNTSNDLFGPKYNDPFGPKYNQGGVSNGTIYLNSYNVPPTIKVLKINGKTIFYYWSGSFFYYSFFDDKKSKDGDTIIFETTNDFILVLKDLNLLVK